MAGTEQNEYCIEARDISVQFPVKSPFHLNRKRGEKKTKLLTAVNHVSLSIRTGETVSLVGESGCGKTTFGRALLRLVDTAPESQILFHGKDISRLDEKRLHPYRAKMQMIFQDPMTSLDPRKTIGTIIAEPLNALHLASGAEAEKKVREAMDMVGLKPDHYDRYPHEFSGGQRQRVGIARALVAHPEFIVCDEPISALDVSIQAQVINILEDLQDKYGYTYLFISHDLSMVRHISDEVGVMYLGSLVEFAPVKELYENMLHPYTQSLMSAIPEPDPIANRNAKRIILTGEVPSPLNPPKGCPFWTRCRRCMEKCAEIRPELRDIGNGHLVACHLVHSDR